MTKYKLEYIWLDGYTPTPNLRGKTQIKEFAEFPTLEQLPLWGFDGSSTMQAEGRSSDCVLKPVRIFPDTERTNGALVLCEVMMPDGETPHPSNKRATILDDEGAWFGFEQEYFFYKNGRPLGFPEQGYPAPQGPYYTGVGYSKVGDVARKIVEEHLDLCLAAGHQPRGHQRRGGQGPVGVPDLRQGLQAGRRRDVARPLSARAPDREVLHRHRVSLQAAGQHRLERLRACTATSRPAYLREVGGKDYFERLMAAFDEARADHIAVYGPDNHLRLTGHHETQSIHTFSYGVADRGASIRVPHSFVRNGYRGYLEDRRPNSQGDPYQIASQVLKTVASVPTGAELGVSAAA